MLRDSVRNAGFTGMVPLLVVLLSLVGGAPADAQQGSLAGTVRAQTGAALASVEVSVLRADGSAAARELTGPGGSYRVTGLESGTYDVAFDLPGWEPLTRQGVRVSSGETTNLSVVLAPSAYELNPLTVSASRQEQKLLDAPASIFVVDQEEVESKPALTSMDYVEGMAGVDVIKSGLQQGYVVARGFNNVFSGSLLSLTDHRIARVPSLRANISHLDPTTSTDIKRIEVVLGPGSALYGPNAASGVLHKITKSPIDDPGATFSLGGGIREQGAVPAALGPGEAFGPSEEGVFHGSARVAHKFSDRFGLEVSGEYFTGDDYLFQDPDEQTNRAVAGACLANFVPANPACVTLAPSAGQLPDPDRLARIGDRDFGLERWTMNAEAEWRPTEASSAIFSYGRTQAVNSIDLTGIGAAQVKDWAYQYAQTRFNHEDLFVQGFVNWSNSADTYILRTGNSIRDESFIGVGQIQHATNVGESQRFVYGADYIHTDPVTNRTINGVHEDEDRIDEFGVYLQSETDLDDQWELTLAARGDYHSVLDEVIFSPRGALVFKPAEEHSVRATFNRAFATPDNNNLFLDILAQRIPLAPGISYGLNAQGTTDRGFTFARDPGGRPMMKSPFLPPALGGPGQFLPTRTPSLWNIAAGIVGQENPALAALMQANVPGEDQVGVLLRSLNTGTGEFELLEQGFAGVGDIPPIQEEITNTFELGYKGLVGDRLLLSVDGYYTEIQDFIGPLALETPNAFLDPQETVQYMVTQLGLDPATAQQVAVGTEENPGIARIPLGVVTPQEVAAPGANLMLTYRNVGDVNLFGADLSATYQVTDRWELGLATSVVEDDVFTTDDGERVELNAPSFKAQGSVGYNDRDAGFRGEVAYRFVNGFPAASGVFVGQVPDYNTVDLNVSYELPGFRDVSLQVDVQNVFDNSYRTFPGSPELGRFTLARIKYQM